jgi:bifunctional enzyme CysN/CysC
MAPSIADYLRRHERKDQLRFITCGSVDDGKSTLIGRLLYDTQRLTIDQLAALERDSERHGTQGAALDFALLVDGLEAEREQGITIDVAYRFFATDARMFIVADCPGHEQYTRNMATGASTADLAVVLIDARKGVLTQSRRHSYIVSLLGVRQVILAVNKMDLVGFDEAVFANIVSEYRALAARFGIEQVVPIPLSALNGDNVLNASSNTPWYSGPSLLSALENAPLPAPAADIGLRLPVQWVNRPHQDFRGFCGTVVAGSVQAGDVVRVVRTGVNAKVASVLDGRSEVASAGVGEAITLTLDAEIDISRGDVIAAASQPTQASDQLAVHVLWMSEAPLLAGRPYLLRCGTATVAAQVTDIKHRVDVDSQELLAAKRLMLNEVGVCNLSLATELSFEPYARCRALGGFILIDRFSGDTVGAGTIDFALRRASNIHWQATEVNKTTRAQLKGQRPRCLWFTGLSGAGKSTIAARVEAKLTASGHHTYLLDGDNVRHGLNRDLGFTDADRVENIRRIAEVAKLMVDAGLIVLVSFISPFRSERDMARALFGQDEFIEIHVDTPLAVAEQRDVKGLYAKARAGQIKNFTGIDSAYEAPLAAELTLNTTEMGVDELAEAVIARALV